MANRTVRDANSIHGTNPQYVVEKIIRTRIYDSKYWKEECFALTAELLVDKAMNLRSLGGIFGGNVKPTPFLCLTLKMLQIQPEKDIVVEFIKQDEFKYVRALGAFYLRLVYTSLDCFKYLEPLLNDYRKLRVMDRNGQYVLSHMDEFVDTLLRDERVFDVILPRMQKRWIHESANELEQRVSLLDEDLENLQMESESEEDEPQVSPRASPLRGRHDDLVSGVMRESRHGRYSPHRASGRMDRDRLREKRRRSRSRDDEKKRRKSRSRERRHKSPTHRHRERPKDKTKSLETKDYKRREERRDREDRHKERGKNKDKKRHRRDRGYREDEDPDIAEANALRAKLGMAPLRL